MAFNFLKRLLFYIIISIFYIYFMTIYAPLGAEWLNWHYQRIYNFSMYLSINGYFSNYGFSIWNKCTDCSLIADNWKGQIYLSSNIFTYLPYVLINEFLGSANLKYLGSLLDKIIIIVSGFLVSEIFIKLTKSKNNILNFKTSLLIFILFITNPWTYKMIIAAWAIIYFIFFLLLSFYFFLVKKELIGFIFLFISGLFDYQSATGLIVFYSFFVLFKNNQKNLNLFEDFFSFSKKGNIKFIIILLFSVFIYFFLRMLATYNLHIVSTEGSDLLERIGVSGNDFHNGGILGALQFLGGNRITQCLVNFNTDLNALNLDQKISIFNCCLSILGMFFISVISIFGLFYLRRSNKKYFYFIISPLIFLILSYIFILQQSSSVHLMGYSYLFSILFSVGLSSLIIKILKKNKFSTISILFTIPVILGIILLSIRVSMLTGING